MSDYTTETAREVIEQVVDALEQSKITVPEELKKDLVDLKHAEESKDIARATAAVDSAKSHIRALISRLGSHAPHELQDALNKLNGDVITSEAAAQMALGDVAVAENTANAVEAKEMQETGMSFATGVSLIASAEESKFSRLMDKELLKGFASWNKEGIPAALFSPEALFVSVNHGVNHGKAPDRLVGVTFKV